MTFNDYPKAATENAKRALKFREETENKNSCGTPVGWARANQLAKREPISLETVKRMSAFNRHRKNKDVPYSEGCGGLMWDAWGGTEGIDWAKRKVEQIEKEQMQNKFKFEILTDVYDNGLEVQRLSNLLEEANGDQVVINIASDGGEVFLGLKFAGLISNYKGETVANIYGFAASISTIIATAASRAYISRFSLFMIHNAWTFLQGNKEELQRQNKTLEEIDGLLAAMYVDKMRRSGTLINNSKEESLIFIRDLMKEESFLSAERAIQLGLVDGYITSPREDLENLGNKEIQNKSNLYKNSTKYSNKMKEKKNLFAMMFAAMLSAFGFNQEDALASLEGETPEKPENALNAPKNEGHGEKKEKEKEEEEEKPEAEAKKDPLQEMEKKLAEMEERLAAMEEEKKAMEEEYKKEKEEKEEMKAAIEETASYANKTEKKAETVTDSIFSPETSQMLNNLMDKAMGRK